MPRPPAQYVVVQGDSISSIAERFGYFPDALWNHSLNDGLRRLRGEPDILLAGDVVHLPPPETKSVACATGRRHVFRRKGTPAKFRVQLFLDDEPRAGQEWTLEIDGAAYASGVADAQGIVESWVPPLARTGTLVVGPDRKRLRLRFGHLDPVAAASGVEQRLRNLGFSTLAEFQERFGLPATGTADDATRAKLAEIHDRPSRMVEPPPQ